MAVARSQLPGRRGPSTSTELDESWVYLREAYHVLRRRRIALLRRFGLSWSEYLALQVSVQAPARPSEIAETGGLTAAGATDVIDRLEERRLVRRTSDPKDRRAVRVEPTRAGLRLYEETQLAQHQEARRLSGALSHEERASLVTGLLAVLRALEEHPS